MDNGQDSHNFEELRKYGYVHVEHYVKDEQVSQFDIAHNSHWLLELFKK